MLQIADGAMSKVQDILVRMKTLAVQAGSGQLSGTERGMLDTEYQSLVSEIDRIASDTEFNGNQLVDGSVTISSNANFGAGAGVINRSEEHTSELQSLMRSSYAVFCLKKKKNDTQINTQELINK